MPPRTRPKKASLSTAHHARLRAKWRRWLTPMSSDLSDLFRRQEIFWQLQVVAKENPSILKNGAFFSWMCNNYIDAFAIRLRACVDQSKGSHSLWRLLYEALENPGAINITTHANLYRNTPYGVAFGESCFRNCVGQKASVLSDRAIRMDMKALEDSSDRLRRFVNKRVAHRNRPGAIRRVPTFDEIDNTLSVIDRLFCKYNFLLSASGMDSCRATAQYDWRDVLWQPWIPAGSPLRPEV